MRDKRAIIIKDPRLQKIRNNLRDILLEAVSSRWNKLFDEMDKLDYTPEGEVRTIDDYSSSELQKYRAYQREQSALRDLANRSICKCVTCGKGERDMVYNKSYDAWYCTECYGMERLSAQKRAKVKAKKRETKHCEEKAIESHSETFL
ncbi:hypothetical protein LCGC14_2253160 [marine sediment metagenome]|uniref:Uncharacterized protein n=1 Tax=marine sediment metagenome TaxID=412755 RepID=A0A0F9FEE2_9ZZZZ